MMKRLLTRVILVVIGTIGLSLSCPRFYPGIHVYNDSQFDKICVVAMYDFGDDVYPSELIGVTSSQISRGGACELASEHITREQEVLAHPNLTFFFLLSDETINTINDLKRYSIGYYRANIDELRAYNWQIHFPSQVTVNPDLWRVYNRQKFIERYGEPTGLINWPPVDPTE